VFRLVCQMRGTVLHLGDLRLGIGPAHRWVRFQSATGSELHQR
jgi:hypothetical protein